MAHVFPVTPNYGRINPHYGDMAESCFNSSSISQGFRHAFRIAYEDFAPHLIEWDDDEEEAR